MFFRIGHRFGELEGTDKGLLNPTLEGHFLSAALQSIDFRMDRGGAEVTSQAITETAKSGDYHYEFNRPFLVYMKKRGESKPFFVIWVENTELMQRW